jgi:hypothetical protein
MMSLEQLQQLNVVRSLKFVKIPCLPFEFTPRSISALFSDIPAPNNPNSPTSVSITTLAHRLCFSC